MGQHGREERTDRERDLLRTGKEERRKRRGEEGEGEKRKVVVRKK